MIPLLINHSIRLREGEDEEGKKFFAEDGLEWLFHNSENSVRRVEYNDWLPTEVHFRIICIDGSEGTFFTRKNLWSRALNLVDWAVEGF